jgi:D-glycero-alpha-D-manno-heptose-7-phosphate kinase
MAELAFHAERIELGYQGGWQDQYASVFGGFSFMEFSSKENEVFSLKVPENTINELEERLILCYCGHAHPTNTIHTEQKSNMKSNEHLIGNAHRTREIAYKMKTALLRGQVSKLGELLHEAWCLKKTLASGISDSGLDSIYEIGRKNGALGGKILGAGGGGFFLFISKQGEKYNLRKTLEKSGYVCRDVNFDDKGVRSWIVRSELQ